MIDFRRRHVRRGMIAVANMIRCNPFLGGIFAYAMTACSSASDRAQLQCVVDYTVEVATQRQTAIDAARGRPPRLETSVDPDGLALLPGSQRRWDDCPDDFRRTRGAALATFQAYRDGYTQLINGPRPDAEQVVAFQTASKAFRTEMLVFAETYALYLHDPRVQESVGDRAVGTVADVLKPIE